MMLKIAMTIVVVMSTPVYSSVARSFRGPNSQCNAGTLIRLHEGTRKCVYVDTTGHHTIGVGYNLDQGGAKEEIESIGANFQDVYDGKSCLSDTQVDKLFSKSLAAAEQEAARDVSSYGSLCCNVQNVITDLAFNLGQAGLASFTTFISYVNEAKFSQAADDLKGTLWCRQVGLRCSGDTSQLARGCGGHAPSPSSHPSPSPPPPGDKCCSCVKGGGGTACTSECSSKGSECTSCIKSAGGKACASRCGC